VASSINVSFSSLDNCYKSSIVLFKLEKATFNEASSFCVEVKVEADVTG
jgi:hypothetical protein